MSDEGEAQTWLAWTGVPAVVKPVQHGAMSKVILEDLQQAPGQLIRAMENGPVLLERMVEGPERLRFHLWVTVRGGGSIGRP